MKNVIVSALVLFMISGCKKNNVSDNTVLLEHYPQEWILTVDENAERYTHIDITSNPSRKLVDKSYSLVALADERDCKLKISQSRNEDNNKDCYKIQSVNDKKKWLLAGPSSNHQEVHLYTNKGDSEITPPGDGDEFKFLIHNMDKVDGVKTIVIESLANPGYYISSSQPGFNYSPTQVVLTHESSPDKATHWQCRN